MRASDASLNVVRFRVPVTSASNVDVVVVEVVAGAAAAGVLRVLPSIVCLSLILLVTGAAAATYATAR
jgi:hypothetical protein